MKNDTKGENAVVFVGLPNPNILMPLEKMEIKNLDDDSESFTVLYNPESYTQEKTVKYGEVPLLGADAPIVQFQSGGAEKLTFELFFDSIYAGAEVGGDFGDSLKFAANSLLPSAGNQIDVREYTKKVTNLLHRDSDEHRPPLLKIKWSKLQFRCFLSSCTQQFIKFDEQGQAVRARLKCSFIEHREIDKLFKWDPPNSPDTTKYHTVRQGDSLWALAAREYGDAGEWRHIAAANGISNPRQLRTGEMLNIPALL